MNTPSIVGVVLKTVGVVLKTEDLPFIYFFHLAIVLLNHIFLANLQSILTKF